MEKKEQSLRKRIETLESNIQVLESNIQVLVNTLNPLLTRLSTEQESVIQVLNAVVDEIGKDVIEASLAAKRQAEREAAESKQAEERKVLVEKGVLVPTEVVAEDTICVVSETKNGQTTTHQYVMSKIENEEAKALLLGKKLGETFDVKETLCVVKEVFTFNAVRANEVLKEEQAKAAEASAPKLEVVEPPAEEMQAE